LDQPEAILAGYLLPRKMESHFREHGTGRSENGLLIQRVSCPALVDCPRLDSNGKRFNLRMLGQ